MREFFEDIGLLKIMNPSDSIFLSNIHHAFAQTNGDYAFPNSLEGDLLKRAKFEIEELQQKVKNLEQLNVDSCETDLNVRKLAAQVLSDFQVHGDSYGVPTLEDITELLINKILKK